MKSCLTSKIFQFLLLFLFLMLVNLDSWFAPPFWDDLIGLHSQAVWLARNNFDIKTLLAFSKMPGTPLYNPLNPMAYIYAVFYKFTTPQWTHFFAHVVNIAAISGCGVLFINILPKISLFVKLLFLSVILSTPLIISSCASTSQESLLAFLIFLGIFFKIKKHDHYALFTSIFSWFFKLTGVFLTFAFIVDAIFITVKKHKFSVTKYIVILLPAIVGIGYYMWHFSSNINHFKWKPRDVIELLLNAYWSLLPLFIIGLIFLRKRIYSYRIRFIIIFILLFFGANFFSSMAALPRYGTIIVFPIIYLFVISMRRFSIKTNIYIAIILNIIHISNMYGMFLPEPKVLQYHDGSFMERSREFTNLRSQDQYFCKFLEKEKSSRLIICSWPMLQQLTIPEFGYVKEPLPNIVAGEYPHSLGNFKVFKKTMLDENPLFLFTPNCYNWKIPLNAKIIFTSNPSNPLCGYIIYQLR